MSDLYARASYGLTTILLSGTPEGAVFPLGTYLLGIVLDAICMGVILSQIIAWILKCRGNSIVVLTMIPLSFLAAVSATCYTWAQALQDFSIYYDQTLPFLQFDISGWYGLIGIMVLAPILVILIHRVHLSAGSVYVTVILGVVCGAAISAGIWVTVDTRKLYPLSNLQNAFLYWGATSVTAQLSATGFLFYGLKNLTIAGTGAARGLSIALQTHIPGTLFSIGALVLIVLGINTTILPLFILTHTKLYLICALAGINYVNTQNAIAAAQAGDIEAGTSSVYEDSVSTLSGDKDAASAAAPAEAPAGPEVKGPQVETQEKEEEEKPLPTPPLPTPPPISIPPSPSPPPSSVKSLSTFRPSKPSSKPHTFNSIRAALFTSDKPTTRMSRDRGELIVDNQS